VLPSGQTVFSWGAVSYNKLRRGTALEIRYALSIRPYACFSLADELATNRTGLHIEMTVSPGLSAIPLQQTDRHKHAEIHGAKVSECFEVAEFKVRVSAPAEQPLGLQRVSGRITWQAVTKDGPLAAQTSVFEFPVEVVEHDDRTARYNESYAYRAKPDLLWRIPALPFVLVYCAVVGGDCPE